MPCPLAEALVAGGLTVLEVTLRTPAALDSIRAMRAAVPDAVVGAGTVINTAQFAAAVAGREPVHRVARAFRRTSSRRRRTTAFRCCRARPTPTEIMAALDAGIDTLKFFPAAQAGGAAMLKALAAPLPDGRVLSDRRHHTRERERLPVAAERALRRHVVDRDEGMAGCR